MTGPPVLWHFPISHYNEKARWALDWKRIPHVRRALAMSYVPRALWATGQAKLPILFLDGQAIADSTRIIEALERLQPDPPLYPRDEAELRPSGYLVGDRFSVADLTAAALLAPVVFPPEFPYRPPGPLPAPVARWRDSLASRPAGRWAAEMYRRHRGTSAEIAA